MPVVTAHADNEDARVRTAFARWVLAEALLLGCFADVALRSQSLGAGLTLWIGALAATLLMLARRRGGRLKREQHAWLAVAVFCSILFAWRDAELLQVTNLLATLFALVMFRMCVSRDPRESILASRVSDLAGAWKRAAKHALGGAAPLWLRDASMIDAFHDAATRRAPFIRAAIITVPLLIIFSQLLGSADPVFGSLFSLPGISLEDAASHFIMAATFTWLCAGSFRGAFLAAPSQSAQPEVRGPRLGIIEITSSLGALNALFALFVGMQLRWLFGGASVVQQTTGLSVAEYARRGFFELVWVAVLVAPVVLGTRALVEGDETAVRRHRRLALPLLGLLGVIMLSAVLRMRLYVMYFGITTDRLYALVFMGWLALVFVFMAATVLRGWSRPFAAISVVSGFAVVFALNLINLEALVARNQIERASDSRKIDYTYLAGLGGDAMPIVARSLATAAPTPSACETAKKLSARWRNRRAEDVTEWNLGKTRGAAAVAEWLTPHSLRRLCASSGTSPSVSSLP